ncbi:MAG: hypothetical protein GC181_00020 [Bacteroidetes bacterium]|nr:hypothetical protein [Bacteroidota bacterium]
MKGIVFTEFLSMIENQYGDGVVDTIINQSELPSGGAYTSVGTYDISELHQLIKTLCRETSCDSKNLLNDFGHHLFGTFLNLYPEFFNRCKHPFDFLESIENHIHREVLKLYPDAELPSFQTNRTNDFKLEMKYTSARHLAELARGLIEASLEHYKKSGTVNSISDPNHDSTIFVIELNR